MTQPEVMTNPQRKHLLPLALLGAIILGSLATAYFTPEVRRDLQIVFQDPLASLDPRMTVGAIIEEPLRVHRVDDDRAKRVGELLELMQFKKPELDARKRRLDAVRSYRQTLQNVSSCFIGYYGSSNASRRLCSGNFNSRKHSAGLVPDCSTNLGRRLRR